MNEWLVDGVREWRVLYLLVYCWFWYYLTFIHIFLYFFFGDIQGHFRNTYWSVCSCTNCTSEVLTIVSKVSRVYLCELSLYRLKKKVIGVEVKWKICNLRTIFAFIVILCRTTEKFKLTCLCYKMIKRKKKAREINVRKGNTNNKTNLNMRKVVHIYKKKNIWKI